MASVYAPTGDKKDTTESSFPLKIRWTQAFTLSGQSNPDLRFWNDHIESDSSYDINIAAYRAPSRFNREMEEINSDSKIHLTFPVTIDSTDVVFKAGDKEIPLTIASWAGNIGMWDNREFEGEVAELSYSLRNDLEAIHPAYVKDQRVAWYASHRHLPSRDTYYEYGYLFAYRIEIPEGVTKLKLPKAPFVHIAAASAGDEGDAEALYDPFDDLHRDKAFETRFEDLSASNVDYPYKD